MGNAKGEVASVSTSGAVGTRFRHGDRERPAEHHPGLQPRHHSIGKVFTDLTGALDLAQANANNAFAIAGTALDVPGLGLSQATEAPRQAQATANAAVATAQAAVNSAIDQAQGQLNAALGDAR